jgi:ABC-type uncharacterized transport system permease subunit
MFLSPQRREAAELAAAENWKLWHKRKRWIIWPLKLAGAAILLSFAYTTGEHAGLVACETVRK